MTRAAIYARVSTPGQKEKDTVGQQIHACLEHCKGKGWQVAYVCYNTACSPPVTEPHALSEAAESMQRRFTSD